MFSTSSTLVSCALALALAAAACGSATRIDGDAPVDTSPTGPVDDNPATPSDGGAHADGATPSPSPACDDGEVLVDGKCVDPITDSSHCGAAGTVCGAGAGCFGGTCTTPTAMLLSHVGAAAVGKDGRIYVFSSDAGAAVGIFNPRTNAWTIGPLSPVGAGLTDAVTLSDGRIAMVGYDDASKQRVIFFFDPVASAWTHASSVTQPVGFGLGVKDMRLYLLGGAAPSVTAGVQSYDVTTNTWATETNMPTARWLFPTVTSAAGHIVALGGEAGAASYVAGVEQYDPATKAWVAIAPIPRAIGSRRAAVGHDGKIYVVGGTAFPPNPMPTTPSVPSNKVDIYDPATSTWSAGPDLSVAAVVGAVVTGNDGRIYALGAKVAGTAQLKVRVYEPSRSLWIN